MQKLSFYKMVEDQLQRCLTGWNDRYEQQKNKQPEIMRSCCQQRIVSSQIFFSGNITFQSFFDVLTLR